MCSINFSVRTADSDDSWTSLINFTSVSNRVHAGDSETILVNDGNIMSIAIGMSAWSWADNVRRISWVTKVSRTHLGLECRPCE